MSYNHHKSTRLDGSLFLITTTLVVLTTLQSHVIGQVVIMDQAGQEGSLFESGLSAQIVAPQMVKMDNMDQEEPTPSSPASDETDTNTDDNNIGQQQVINGMPSYPAMFQHQAALLVNTSDGLFLICGAVLIDKRHALTAAHCTVYFSGNVTFDHFLAVGIHNRTLGLGNPGSQMVAISHAKDHHGYQDGESGWPNDIAVLYLEEDVVNNTNVQYAELAHPDMGNFSQEVCVISGWGFTRQGLPDILQFAYQYIPSEKTCRQFWAPVNDAKITSKHICGYNYPTSGCSGDSGGPLTCGAVVAGLVSWGLGSCSGCMPTVYTRISSHYDWIIKAIE